jgi:hypothetical protein
MARSLSKQKQSTGHELEWLEENSTTTSEGTLSSEEVHVLVNSFTHGIVVVEQLEIQNVKISCTVHVRISDATRTIEYECIPTWEGSLQSGICIQYEIIESPLKTQTYSSEMLFGMRKCSLGCSSRLCRGCTVGTERTKSRSRRGPIVCFFRAWR